MPDDPPTSARSSPSSSAVAGPDDGIDDGFHVLARAEQAVRDPLGTAVPDVVVADATLGAVPNEVESDTRRVARRVAIATLVAGGIVVAAFALWKIRLVVTLLFLAIVIASAMRPGVESLARRRVPRGLGVALHYLALAGLLALFFWLVVPQAIDQVQGALGEQHTVGKAARESTGLKHDLLAGLDRELRKLPSGSELVHPVIEAGRTAVEVVVGIFFTFAAAAYWIFERDRAIGLVASLVARPRRKRLRDTWELIDRRLGAFVRGQLVLIVLVGAVLSVAFWAIGMPYWLLVGAFAGLIEMVPVIGPLLAGAVAVGVGLTASVHVAALAAVAVVVVRLAEDYVVIPRVLGHSVGLSPLVVLTSVTSVGILFGGFAVVLAIPIASVLATVLDVAVRDRDPAEETVPTLLFPAKDAE